MAGTTDLVVLTLVLRNARTQSVRGPGLAFARNVVVLAFDRQQRRLGDVLRANALELALRVCLLYTSDAADE